MTDMKDYYATRAPEYDAIYRKPERQSDLAALAQWLPPLFANATVLEVACGTGHWTQFIAPTAAHVTALDASDETMAIAAQRVPADKVDFVNCDAYALPRDLGSFDAAFAGFWFSHVPRARRQAFLRNLGERLRPGARVVLVDNLFVEGSSTPIADRDADGDTFQSRPLADGSVHRVLKNFPDDTELHDAIDGIGHDGRMTRWTYFWAFDYRSG